MVGIMEILANELRPKKLEDILDFLITCVHGQMYIKSYSRYYMASCYIYMFATFV